MILSAMGLNNGVENCIMAVENGQADAKIQNGRMDSKIQHGPMDAKTQNGRMDAKIENGQVNPQADGRTGYTVHHGVVFFLTFASYLQITALRKTQSYVKATVVEVWTPPPNGTDLWISDVDGDFQEPLFATKMGAEKFLGALDSIFMFAYSVGLYFLGSISDRFEPRLVLALGMAAASIMSSLFGFVTERCNFYSAAFYVCIWLINAVCQSACWPTVVKLMDNWYEKSNRGLVFGLWSSAASFGSIVGAYVCASMLEFGYEYTFLVNSSLLFAVAIMVYFGAVSAPKDLHGQNCANDFDLIQVKKKSRSPAAVGDVAAVDVNNRPKPMGFLKALLIPGVIAYALAYTCLKSVNYSIFFWLPYYMRSNFGWEPGTSAMLATYFDWGGILGSTVCGFASDLLGKRSPILVAMLVLSIFALGGYSGSPDDKLINAILMGIVGFFVNGATNLVSSAVTADLGHGKAGQSKEALSTVSGIIEGSGSFGAAVGQAILPLIADTFGWNAIFYMFMVMLFVSVVLLSRLCYRETKEAIVAGRLRILQLSGGIGERAASPDVYVVDNGHFMTTEKSEKC